MYRIVERRMVAPNLHELVVEAPEVAAAARPGHFVILRPDEVGERIPLSIADWDEAAGTVTCVFMQVGATTAKLARLAKGGGIPTFAGPLGKGTDIERFGTVVCVGGCYGIGSIYPVARALKAAGNVVFAALEARSSYLFYWRDRFEKVCDRVLTITRDGTAGAKGHVKALPELFAREGITPDRVIANGCTFQMMKVSEATRPSGVKTIVNMNPIMIDGTGMCGVCRLTVGGATKFACVDGPDFDGHQVDWKEFLARRQSYTPEEVLPTAHSGCAARF